MIYVYNILQLLFLTILGPLFLVFCFFIPKYRIKIGPQLGFGVNFPPEKSSKKRIWIHALSVGEVTSARPLLRGIKNNFSNVEICFSAATTSGQKTAKSILTDYVDYFISPPVDLLPVVLFFFRHIQPDLYIHVETDFWLNRLKILKKYSVPTILVNGRISETSFQKYLRAKWIFGQLFSAFDVLAMQTEQDRNNMITLGVAPEKVVTLGNLKYDVVLAEDIAPKQNFLLTSMKKNALLIVAGSTHAGEEEILLDCFTTIRQKHPDTQLLIAPRNIERGKEIEQISLTKGFTCCLRTTDTEEKTDIIILDTLGELFFAYQVCDIAFVGGSMVRQGGHNPIEPAVCQVPVLFGDYMDDFREISQGLVTAGGAIFVKNPQHLSTEMDTLLSSEETRKQRGKKGFEFITEQKGTVEKHLKIIQKRL